MQKTVIVTGGSRGIGRATALLLAAHGWNVVVNYANNHDEAASVVAEIVGRGGRANAVRANVSSASDIKELFDQAEGAYGNVNALVNSAGIIRPSLLKDLDDAALTEQLDTNLRGTINAIREASRRLVDGGRIVSMSSTTLALNPPTYGIYNATKAAIEALTRVVAKELGVRRITVNAVAPGPVETELFVTGKSQAEIDRMAQAAPFKRLGQPRDIAEVVAFLLSDAAGWINGQVVRANGGLA
ncbi:SDR family oxidoreductase [Rhizobium sp. NFR03]|uniref:SDR family oxidoreductase n=1 Tax=Rhizobium sp. NFR03 TaxID=1566263 RepID=UPI0008B426D3|nr:SDR family oxidoreductase [Rhizobium sp. NFR03]SES45524.1 3-oxoacyl-[acyl-carrier protein] reductase [Rhizobium sp. NFR03]